MPAPERPLSPADVARANELIVVMRSDFAGFVRFGTYLEEFRDRKLWRALNYTTFTEFVKREFGLSHSEAYRKIGAAKAIRSVGEQTPSETSRAREKTTTAEPEGHFPVWVSNGKTLKVIPSERAASELAKVPEDRRAEVFRRAVQLTPQRGEQTTRLEATMVRKAMRAAAIEPVDTKVFPEHYHDHRRPPDPEPLPETDEADRPVLSDHVRAALAQRGRFRRVIKLVEDALAAAVGLAEDESGIGRDVHTQSVEAGLKSAITYLRQAMPHASCPRWPQCKVGCRLCKGTLWVSRHVWDATPKKVRDESKPVPKDAKIGPKVDE